MNGTDFLEKINDIDDDLVSEASETEKTGKFPVKKAIAAAACFAVIAAAAAGTGIYLKKRPAGAEAAEIKNEAALTDVREEGTCTGSPVSGETGTPAEDEKNETTGKNGTERAFSGTEPADGGTETVYGGGSSPSSYGGVFIPAVPKNTVKTTGEKLTDEEAKAYFEKNGGHIVSSLSASGVPADNIRISDTGYGHLSYDGSTMDYVELRQNFRDYPVFNGDELVAIVTLYKSDGEIFDSPAFGAPWFGEYNNILKRHSGEKLVYLYAGQFTEIIIAPDNTCYNPLGTDVSAYFEGLDDPYGYFLNDGAVYVP